MYKDVQCTVLDLSVKNIKNRVFFVKSAGRGRVSQKVRGVTSGRVHIDFFPPTERLSMASSAFF